MRNRLHGGTRPRCLAWLGGATFALAALAQAAPVVGVPQSAPAARLLDPATIESLPVAADDEDPGRNPRRWWRSEQRVRYLDVFPGVDLVLAHTADRLEAIYLLQPGADPGAIRIALPRTGGARLPQGGVALGGDDRMEVLTAPQGWVRRARRLAEVDVLFTELTPRRLGIAVPDHDPARLLYVHLTIEASIPGAPEVTASAVDSFVTDSDSDGEADPGDVLQYDVTIDNTAGTADAEDVELEFTEDSNTTAAVHNITPIALDQTVTTPEDTALGITLTGTDFDAGETATLTFTLLTDPPVAEGSLTGTPPDLTFTPAADFNGATSFTFEVQDAKGDASNEPGTITVNVSAVNDAPTFTSASAVNAPENQTAVVDLDADDPEGDTEGSGLTYAITGGADQALFSVVANTGVLTFDTAPDFDAPGDANTDNVYEVEVTLTDSGGETAVQSLQVTVTDANDAPSLTSSTTPSAAENQTAVIDLTASDPDGETEGGGGLTYSITGGADQGDFSIVAGTGVLTFIAAPDFEAPGDANTDNVYEVQVTVTDAGGLTDSQDLQVTVTDANDAPSITSSATPGAAENQTAAIDVQSTDPDGESEGAGLTYSITGGADQALFSIVAATGVLSFNAAPNFEAPGDANTDNVYEVQVTVTDSGGLSDVQNLQVTVTNVNEAPLHTGSTFGEKLQASAVDFQTVGNTAFRFGPTQPAGEISVFVDSDTEGGDLLDNWSDPEMAGLSTVAETVATTNGGSVTIAADGTYVYTPPSGTTVADDQFTYQVTDGGSTASRNVTIDVIAPVIWYVENDAAAGGGGSSTEPFDTLAEAQTASGTGDTIYVREGDGTSTGQDAGIELKNNQVLLGEGVALSVSATVNGVVDPTLLAAANRPVIANGGAGGTGDAVRLVNISGTVRGLEIAAAIGDGIEVLVDGGGTHTVTIEDNVIGGLVAPVGAGMALRASNGMLTATVNRNTGVYSAADDGFFANGSGGTLYITQFAGNSVSGNTAGDGFDIRDAIFDADPGDAAFTGDTVSWGDTDVGSGANRVGTNGIVLTNVTGAISFTDLDTFAANGHAVQVVNAGGNAFDAAAGTGFEITFPSGSTLDATGGAALDVDPADVAGTISTANATGGSAGILLEDVGGSLTISGGSLTNINGIPFAIVDGTVGVVYDGDITQGNNFAAVSVSGGHQTGTVTFQTGTINATSGTGLQFDNADGTYEFDGTTTLNGGDAGIDILNGSGGAFTFGAGAAITDPSGLAFNLSGGAATVTYEGTITQTRAATAVNVTGATGGSRSFTGAITASTSTATGIDIDGAGTTTFSGGLDIDTTTAIGFQATGGGTVNATGTNTIDVGAAPHGLDLNGVTIGASDLAFANVSSSSATTGELIDIDSTSNAGTISIGTVTSVGTVSGAGIDIDASSAGFSVTGTATISNTAGAGINLNGANGAVSLNTVVIDNTAGAGIDIAGNTDTVTISGGTIGASNDPTGNVVDVSGGSGAVSVGATLTKSSAGRIVEVTGRTAGVITISGNLACSGACTGINIRDNTSGSTTLSGSTKTINTGANSAVFLRSNGTHTVNFTGGGLDIDTTSGTGIETHTSGTNGVLTVTGAGNSVTTTDGRILHWTALSIGADGVTFASLTKNGSTASNAIEFFNVDGPGSFSGGTLSVTGANHGFQVWGNSSAAFGFTSATMNDVKNGIRTNQAGNGPVTFDTVSINAVQQQGVMIDSSSNGDLTISGGSIGDTDDPGGDTVQVDNMTGGTVTIAASLFHSSNHNLVDIGGLSGGSVTLSGNLSKISTTRNAIEIADNTGGTVTFSGSSKVLSTGGTTAVAITNSPGTTVNFTGGGLDIDTTSGTGLDATSGTINVTGANNTVDTTTGTAVDIDGATIGTSGVEFKSISVNGAANGIVLSNTGSSGAFTVAGDGTKARNDSGGVIQNTTGHGISLTNANDVTLQSMRIDTLNTASTHAINSSGGSDVVLSGMTVQNLNGNSSTGWMAVNLGGVNRIDSDSLFTALGATAGGAVDLRNTGTNMTSFTIDDSNFTNQNGSNNTTVVFVEALGNSNMGTVTVDNGSEFSGLQGVAFEAESTQTSTLETIVRNSVFKEAVSGGLNTLEARAADSSTHTVTFENNDFDDVRNGNSGSSGSLIVAATDTSSLTANITGNEFKDIDSDGDVVTDGRGIQVVANQTAGGGTVDVTIDDNVVDDVGKFAIYVSARGQSPDMDVRIRDNLVGTIDPGSLNFDRVQIEATDDANLDVLVSGNTMIGAPSTNAILSLFPRADGAANTPVLNATILNNTFTNIAGGGRENVVVRTIEATDFLCLNMTGNTINGVTTIDLDNGAAGTFNVTQTLAELSTDNGGATVNGTGTITYNQPACTLPNF